MTATQSDITLTGYTGTIISGKYRQMVDLAGQLLGLLHLQQLLLDNEIARYRAIVRSGICGEIPSGISIVSIIPTSPPTITPLNPTICYGQSISLTANSNFNSNELAGMDFNNAGAELNGWCIDGNLCSQSDWNANKDNNSPCQWGLTNDLTFGGHIF